LLRTSNPCSCRFDDFLATSSIPQPRPTPPRNRTARCALGAAGVGVWAWLFVFVGGVGNKSARRNLGENPKIPIRHNRSTIVKPAKSHFYTRCRFIIWALVSAAEPASMICDIYLVGAAAPKQNQSSAMRKHRSNPDLQSVSNISRAQPGQACSGWARPHSRTPPGGVHISISPRPLLYQRLTYLELLFHGIYLYQQLLQPSGLTSCVYAPRARTYELRPLLRRCVA
jgi:hypothetical protein